MRILSVRSIDGPNVHISRPILSAALEMAAYTDRETREYPGLNDILLTLLPGLHDHHCAQGRAGGFVERLHTGTYFGHVVEHVALELSTLAGAPANFGKTRVTDSPSVYNVIVEAPEPAVMQYALQLAVEMVSAAATTGTFAGLEARLDEARILLARTALGPSTRAIVESARRR